MHLGIHTTPRRRGLRRHASKERLSMVLAALGAVGVIAVAHPGVHGVASLRRSLDDSRLLATPSPRPANGVYSVRGYGYNNREWVSRGVTRHYAPALHWGGPGPAHYGAHEYDFSRVYVRRGAAMIVVSPWVSLDSNGMRQVERARIEWLREMGYVGGVRTFRNWRADMDGDGVIDREQDREREEVVDDQTRARPRSIDELRPGIDFHPAATIRVPDHIRRARPRFQVIRPVEAPETVAQIETPKVQPEVEPVVQAGEIDGL
jgi:hypothetical protein